MAKLHYRSISKRMVEALEVDRDTIFWDRELSGFGGARLCVGQEGLHRAGPREGEVEAGGSRWAGTGC